MSEDDEPLGDLRETIDGRSTADGEDEPSTAEEGGANEPAADDAGGGETGESGADENGTGENAPRAGDEGSDGGSEERSRGGADPENAGDEDRSGRTSTGQAGPLDELRSEVDERRDRTDVTDDHFAEMDVEDVDEEAVWADLLLEDGPREGSFPPTATEEGNGGPTHVVTKQLCHRCEYFGDPPTLHCTHEGTEILELVDMDHYRVRDCPMVDPEDTVDRDEGSDAGDF